MRIMLFPMHFQIDGSERDHIGPTNLSANLDFGAARVLRALAETLQGPKTLMPHP